ncbi:hypothetical protein B0919_08615 [Hymenobacter sp. CRA2]|nr:hypothetical protein B0919_08615 [Hymenobacter sp. CRA2]
MFGAGLLSVSAQQSWAQATPAPLVTSPYTQNFDGLATSGTTNTKATLPTGWDFLEVNGTGTSANDQYAADNGAANGGNTYSYGATNGTDRAFGALLSGAQSSILGGSFINNTGAPLTSLTISYVGETWRVGAANRSDKLTFQYSTDATSLSTSSGTWTDVTALDYANPGGATTNGISTPAHTATITSTITGLNIPAGATFWIRWNDFNATSSDDGMAVDDFQLSWGTANPNAPTVTLSAATLAFPSQNINTTSAPLSYTVSGANLTGDVTVTASGPFTISKDNTTFTSSLTLTTAELGAAKTLYVKFAPTATGGATGSITHTSAGAATKTLALTGTGADPNQTVFNFQTCTGTTAISDGWTQVSVTGAQTWACTNFGRNANDPTASAASGVQINGFASGNQPNEDWLISPAFDLSTYNFPLFSFWSRTAFAGPGLKLRVSTNYTGTGNPSSATWTDLAVRFPQAGSDIWTQTPNVNLSAFKAARVYVAFVYTSTTQGAARWTLDDIQLTNSATAPAPTVYTDQNRLAFGYQVVNTNGDKQLLITSNDLTGGVTLTSSNPAFTLSKDGTTFASTLTLTQAEANGAAKTVTVRFRPTAASTTYNASIAVTSPGATASSIAVTGDTYDVANTLEVVNWNIEWFGSTAQGPTDDNQQQANVKTILTNLNADVFALAEVVDTTRLNTLVSQMPGYAYRVSDFGSYADSRTDTDYPSAQKLAFVYRTSVVSNVSVVGLLRCTQTQGCAAYTAWASGRFPYMMTADVTLNGVTKRINFVLIHAKANSTATSADDYARRKAGADALKAELDANYATSNIIILGDYNDVLNGTIATGVTPPVSSYNSFMLDQANYTALTLPLAQAGQQSTVSYNTVIDNVIVSNELSPYFIPSSAAIRTDVTSLVSNYASTTTDHYPVQTRYDLSTSVTGTKLPATAKLGLYPNPVSKSIRVEVPERSQSLQLQVLTTDGRLVVSTTGSLEQLNQQLNQKVGALHAGMYVVRIVGQQNTYVERFVKQ